MASRVFHTEGITKVYRTGEVDVHALRGVDTELFMGEFTVLLGASGSGKSTLLNILGGLDSATEGHAWFRDLELTAMTERELTRYRRNHVGFVFQFYNLVPSLTARENVALVTEVAKSPMAPEEALERVGLSKRVDHVPAELSGGEQQRVAVARALSNDPLLLLADEPSGNLDHHTSSALHDLLFDIRERRGTSMVLVTHTLELAGRADRVLRLVDGTLGPA